MKSVRRFSENAIPTAAAIATGLFPRRRRRRRLGYGDLQPDHQDDTSILDALPGTKVQGVLAVIGDVVIRWGDLPPIVRARVDERLITAGRRPV